MERLTLDSRDPLLVSAPIWLVLDGTAVPEVDWYDAPLSVLGSMGAAVTELLAEGFGELYFFEGSYFVQFDATADGAVEVTAADDSDEDAVRVLATVTVPVADLVGAYLDQRAALAAWARTRGEAELLAGATRLPDFAHD